jgi:nucleotide-binding universal stress UspA family protein
MDLLGDPPDWSKLDAAFWDGQAGRMLADLRAEMEQIALRAADVPIAPESVPALWNEAILFREAADWARQYAGMLVRGITDNTRESVGRAVQGFVETPGRTIGQLRDELAPLFNEARAQRIAVTETTRAYAEGTRLVQEQLARAGIVMEQVWNTAMDELVCSICAPNNGKRKSAGWTVDGVPAHPNCRCWVTLEMMP